MNIIDYYQSGGFTLPQVSSGVPTVNPIGSEFAIQSYGKNTQQSFNNYLQGEQLILQKSSNAMQTIDSINRQRQQKFQNAIAQQVQERQMKMYDLQNRKFEQEVMANNQIQFQKLLDMDNDLFLEADNDRIQKQFITDKIDDQTLNDTIDFRDSDAIYAAQRKRSAYLSQYKDAYTNKKQYSDAIARINDPNIDKQISTAAAKNILDVDNYTNYTTAVTNLQKKLEDFRYNGTPIDWTKDADWQTVQSTRTFVDGKQLKSNMATYQTQQNLQNQKLAVDALADIMKQSEEFAIWNSVLPASKQVNMDGSNFGEVSKLITPEEYEKITQKKAQLDREKLIAKEQLDYEYAVKLHNSKRETDIRLGVGVGKNSGGTTLDTNGVPYIKRGSALDYGTFTLTAAGNIGTITIDGSTVIPSQYLKDAKEEKLVMHTKYNRKPGDTYAYFELPLDENNEEDVVTFLNEQGVEGDSMEDIIKNHPNIYSAGNKIIIKGDVSTLSYTPPTTTTSSTTPSKSTQGTFKSAQDITTIISGG